MAANENEVMGRVDLELKMNGPYYYTVVDKSVEGKYPRVDLRTKNEAQAVRRLKAIETITDTNEAQQRISYIVEAGDDKDEESRRIAKFNRRDMLKPSVSLDEAKEELEDLVDEIVDDETALRWHKAIDTVTQAAILSEFGLSDSDIIPLLGGIKSKGARKLNPDWRRKNYDRRHEQLAEFVGLDPERFRHEDASTHRLSECLPVWIARKQTEGVTPKQITAVENAFKSFIDHVGDKPLNKLSKGDFVTYQNHLNANQGKRANKWFKDRFKRIGQVLTTARGRVDWNEEFPDGLDNWLKIKKDLLRPADRLGG